MSTTEDLFRDYIRPGLYFQYSWDNTLTKELLLDLQYWYIRKYYEGCWLLQELPRTR